MMNSKNFTDTPPEQRRAASSSDRISDFADQTSIHSDVCPNMTGKVQLHEKKKQVRLVELEELRTKIPRYRFAGAICRPVSPSPANTVPKDRLPACIVWPSPG